MLVDEARRPSVAGDSSDSPASWILEARGGQLSYECPARVWPMEFYILKGLSHFFWWEEIEADQADKQSRHWHTRRQPQEEEEGETAAAGDASASSSSSGSSGRIRGDDLLLAAMGDFFLTSYIEVDGLVS